MSRAGRIKVDPHAYKIDRRFFRRVWALSKPYWVRKGSFWSWAAMTVLLLLVPVYSILGAVSASVLKDQTNMLVARNEHAFWVMLGWTTLVITVRVVIYAVQSNVEGRLYLHWRRWLTTDLVNQYLAKRTYFEITVDQSIDNPDERIQEEVDPFCMTIAMLPRMALGSFADMAVQAGILWAISPLLFWFVVAYAAFKSVVMFFLYKPTIKYNYDITVAEADLRYGLLHVRDNAESVAFFRGEHAEKPHIDDRLQTVIAAKLKLVLYNARLYAATMGLFNVWTILPLIFLAPMYFHKQIAYGTIAQGTFAGTTILNALSILMNFVPSVSSAVPRATRLAEIQEKFILLGRPRVSTPAAPLIKIVEGPRVTLEHVSLQTPNGEIALVKDLSLEVGLKDHLVIVGQTGVGKSALLRGIAGLWTRGTGQVTVPPPGEVLFLPQRPYMILADLRSQLLYPGERPDITDAELLAVLEQTNLIQVMEKHGGLTAEKDWGRTLSLGEQQRIGFARALVNRPRYVFLDEATSAVDVATELKLYEMLLASGSTFISVGHRPTILRFHRTMLRLLVGGKWQLQPVVARPPAGAASALGFDREWA